MQSPSKGPGAPRPAPGWDGGGGRSLRARDRELLRETRRREPWDCAGFGLNPADTSSTEPGRERPCSMSWAAARPLRPSPARAGIGPDPEDPARGGYSPGWSGEVALRLLIGEAMAGDGGPVAARRAVRSRGACTESSAARGSGSGSTPLRGPRGGAPAQIGRLHLLFLQTWLVGLPPFLKKKCTPAHF